MCNLTAFHLLLVDFTLSGHIVLGVLAVNRRGQIAADQKEKHG
jgi:hypothetical protein